jgi:hypothetical protein
MFTFILIPPFWLFSAFYFLLMYFSMLLFFVVFFSASFLSNFFFYSLSLFTKLQSPSSKLQVFFYYYAQKFLELLRRRRYSFSFHSPSQLSFIAFSSPSWKLRQIFLSATFLFQSVVINRRDIQRRYNCQSHIRFYWPLEAAIATTLYAASIYAPFVRLLTAKCDLHYVFHLVKNV